MKYNFGYFRVRKETDKFVDIEADNDREAVLKFFDSVGECEFGCIREDGTGFTDEDFKTEKDIILGGC